jgi:hypothetical protein
MAHDDIAKNRERFVKELQQTASERAIPIERLTFQDIPDKDAFELTIKVGGKERVFTITASQSINDSEGEIELIINQIRDNE